MDGRPSPQPGRGGEPRRPRPVPGRPPAPVSQPVRLSFSPDRRLTALAGGGAVGALLVLLISSDSGGRLMAAVAAVLLLGYVVTDLVYSPRLVASAAGLVIRSPFSRATVSWAEVSSVRADTRVRHGLRSTNLEIDAGPTLAVLSRRALGADPVTVAELIEAVRPPR